MDQMSCFGNKYGFASTKKDFIYALKMVQKAILL